VAAARASFSDIGVSLPGYLGSVAWGDYDGDGDLDILLGGYSSDGSAVRIFRNDAGSFVDMNAGLGSIDTSALAWGDYDNDGDLDIVLTGVHEGTFDFVSRVFRNDAGSFTDIGADIFASYQGSLEWGDYDNDGDLDILLTGSREGPFAVATIIYRNDEGSFTDIGAGLPNVSGDAAWGDYDNDGDLDVLLAGGDLSPDSAYAWVFRNDAGSFTDASAGLQGVRSDSFVEWGDYDNDGDLDILIGGSYIVGSDDVDIVRVYRNDDGSFSDIGAGLPGVSGAAAWGDFDNDGDLDILLVGRSGGVNTARIHRNDSGVFVDMDAGLLGLSRFPAVAWGDYDSDGDLDIVMLGNDSGTLVTRIYENLTPATNTPPTPPTGPNASVDEDIVTFTWNQASDAQTPVAGLSYNLRVGLTPGGNEVVSGMASGPNGVRRIVARGNAQQRRSWSIDVSAIQPSGRNLYWSVQAIDSAFGGSVFAPEQVLDLRTPVATPPAPDQFALYQNAPNPFNPRTTIRFELVRPGAVDLAVYDLAGRRVRTLVNGARAAGEHAVHWSGRDESGRRVASGTYLYRLSTGTWHETRRMTLVE